MSFNLITILITKFIIHILSDLNDATLIVDYVKIVFGVMPLDLIRHTNLWQNSVPLYHFDPILVDQPIK